MTDMNVASSTGGTSAGGAAGAGAEKWYALSADEVTRKLGVDASSGLSATSCRGPVEEGRAERTPG